MRRYCFLLLLMVNFCKAQENEIQLALELMAAHYDSDGFDQEELTEKLFYYLVHPLLINECTYAQLIAFPLLNERQALHILLYRSKYGQLRSATELVLIPQFPKKLIEVLLPFVSFKGHSVRKKKMKLKWCSTRKISWNNTPLENEQENQLGTEANYFSKLKLHGIHSNWQLNLNVEKDPGELLYHPQKGIEHLGYNIKYENSSSFFKEVLVGTYSLTMGQGLAISTGFNNYKNRWIYNGLSFVSKKIKPQNSNDERNSLRGIVTEMQWRDFNWVLFYSNSRANGTIKKGADNQNYISSLSQSGIHSTEEELRKKSVLKIKETGGALSYSKNFWNLSWNHVFSKLSMPIRPEIRFDNYYQLSGNHFYVQSFDFNVLWKNVNFSSELAMDHEFNPAWIFSFAGSLFGEINYRFLYRNYSRKFKSFRGQSYQRSNKLQGEEGIALQIAGHIGTKWTYHAFQDVFKFPNMTYQKRFASLGKEQGIRLNFNNQGPLQFFVKIKHKKGQKNKANGIAYNQVNEQKTGFTLHYSYQVKKKMKVGGQFQYVVHTLGVLQQQGALVFKELRYKTNSFFLNPRITVFSTDGYQSRIYVYQPSLTYVSPFLFFKGTGISFSCKISHRISEQLTLSARLYQFFIQQKTNESLGSFDDSATGGINLQLKLKI